MQRPTSNVQAEMKIIFRSVRVCEYRNEFRILMLALCFCLELCYFRSTPCWAALLLGRSPFIHVQVEAEFFGWQVEARARSAIIKNRVRRNSKVQLMTRNSWFAFVMSWGQKKKNSSNQAWGGVARRPGHKKKRSRHVEKEKENGFLIASWGVIERQRKARTIGIEWLRCERQELRKLASCQAA